MEGQSENPVEVKDLLDEMEQMPIGRYIEVRVVSFINDDVPNFLKRRRQRLEEARQDDFLIG